MIHYTDMPKPTTRADFAKLAEILRGYKYTDAQEARLTLDSSGYRVSCDWTPRDIDALADKLARYKVVRPAPKRLKIRPLPGWKEVLKNADPWNANELARLYHETN